MGGVLALLLVLGAAVSHAQTTWGPDYYAKLKKLEASDYCDQPDGGGQVYTVYYDGRKGSLDFPVIGGGSRSAKQCRAVWRTGRISISVHGGSQSKWGQSGGHGTSQGSGFVQTCPDRVRVVAWTASLSVHPGAGPRRQHEDLQRVRMNAEETRS